MNYPILIIIPTFNRAHSVPLCIQSFTTHGTGLADYFAVERRTELGMQAALNSVPMALLAQYEIVGIINDDVRMRTPGWDQLVYGKLRGKTGLVYGRDGIQDDRLATQPFFSAHVATDIGLLAPPAPFRNLNDIFWGSIFNALNRVEYVAGLFTEHLHHSAGKAPYDETYRRNDEAYAADRARWPEFAAHQLPSLIAKIKVV